MWFRGTAPAVKTGAVTAARVAAAWFHGIAPAVKTGAGTAARVAIAWFHRIAPVVKTGAGTAARITAAWFRGIAPAVKTGAVAAARVTGTGLRKARAAVKTIQWDRFGLLIKNRLKNLFRGETPAEKYGGFAGAGILFLAFFGNIFLLKQPDIGFPLQDLTGRTLVFIQWWEHSLNTGILEDLIDEFERQNPDIRITLDTRSYTEIRELLTGAGDSAGGQNADILGLDPQWLAETAVTERLEPLSRYYKKSEVSGFYTGAETPYGEWGRPLVSFMVPLLYNIDLLAAAGFDRPPKNQADFAAFAKALTGPDRYGFAIALSPEDPRGLYRDILPWIRSSVSFAGTDGELRFGAAEISAAFNFLNGLQKDGSLAPGSFTKTGKDRVGEFMEGRVAMLIASMADTRPLHDAGFNYGITTIPLRNAYTGKPLYALDQWYMGISRNTRYKEDALLFIDFLAGQAPVLSEHSGSIPWNDNTGGSYTGEYPLLSKAYDIYYTGETRTEYAEGWKTSLFEKIMTEELRLMLEAGQNPEDTAKNIQRRLEAGN
jgi:multiple sugar transport system substrate-binding protein